MAGRFRLSSMWRLDRWRAPAEQANERGDQEQHHGNEEDDLCDLDRKPRDSTESEHRGDQRNDQERQSPTEHDGSPHDCAALKGRVTRKTVAQGEGSWADTRLRPMSPKGCTFDSAPRRLI